jgi:hypothetical protein
MARGGCCRGCRSEDGGAVRNTLFLGLTLGLSFLFLVLAAAIYKDYYPFLNIAFVVLVPVAVIIGDSLAGGGGGGYGVYSESGSAWANMGHCFFGTVLISMFGLPLVLLHIGTVTPPGFGLWIASTVVTTFAAIFFWFARRKKDY